MGCTEFFVALYFDVLRHTPSPFNMDALKSQSLLVLNLGISEHYTSISRGVVDSRDVVYFVGLTCVSLAAARTALQSRNW